MVFSAYFQIVAGLPWTLRIPPVLPYRPTYHARAGCPEERSVMTQTRPRSVPLLNPRKTSREKKQPLLPGASGPA